MVLNGPFHDPWPGVSNAAPDPKFPVGTWRPDNTPKRLQTWTPPGSHQTYPAFQPPTLNLRSSQSMTPTANLYHPIRAVQDQYQEMASGWSFPILTGPTEIGHKLPFPLEGDSLNRTPRIPTPLPPMVAALAQQPGYNQESCSLHCGY